MDPGDVAMVAAAVLLAGSAGLLQATVSGGEQGLQAFLMKEKRDNPFYSKKFKAEKPKAPPWLNGLRLPALPFVEVYGSNEPSATATGPFQSELSELYRQLDEAVEVEDYAAAALIKQKIDVTAAASSADVE